MTLRIIDLRKPVGPEQLEALRQGLHLAVGTGYLARRREWSDWTEQVHKIIQDVADRGDQAVIEYTQTFDRLKLTADKLRVAAEELDAAERDADPSFLAAVRRAAENIRSYQERIKPKSFQWDQNGTRLGIRFEPIRRVGVYAPGGKAVYPSTVLMTVIPAQVAGVEEIAVCCSPGFAGKVDPTMLAVCSELGVTEVYQIGGAQAIAALALGTQTIKRVGKIVGPGNIYVQLAKKELFGQVDIDSFAGPSEVLIMADKTARPEFVAADMLAQAEHDPGSALLVTPSEKLAQQVAQAVERELKTAARAKAIHESLGIYSAAVVVADMDEAVTIANDFAPEHLQVMVAEPKKIIGRLKNAGAIFIGHYTPVALGDYYAGPSHVLPTSGTAKVFSGLSVYDFLKRTSLISYDQQALSKAGADIEVLAKAEGLDMHSRSVTARMDKKDR